MFAFMPTLGLFEFLAVVIVIIICGSLLLIVLRSGNFKEEEAILPVGLPESEIAERIEEVLNELGRVRVDKRGGIRIDPWGKFGSFLTDVVMEGQVRERPSATAVSIQYTVKPSIACWVIAAVLLLSTIIGAAILLVPIASQPTIKKTVRRALDDLEDSFGR